MLSFCLPTRWDNALDIFVLQLTKSSLCMISQDNCGRFSKTFHVQVMGSWGRHGYSTVQWNTSYSLENVPGLCSGFPLSFSQPLLWLKLSRVQPSPLMFLCGWSSVFIQLHTSGFWVGSRHWTLQLHGRRELWHVEKNDGLAHTGVKNHHQHCHWWGLNGLVGSGLNIPPPTGLRTITGNSDFCGSNRIWSLLYYNCLENCLTAPTT